MSASSGNDDNLSHYAGLEQSDNTGILHAQFRDYDSALGRWLSPNSYLGSYDWTNPQTFNRFTYAMNNPLGSIDPSGLSPCGDAPDAGKVRAMDDGGCDTDGWDDENSGGGDGGGWDGGDGFGSYPPAQSYKINTEICTSQMLTARLSLIVPSGHLLMLIPIPAP